MTIRKNKVQKAYVSWLWALSAIFILTCIDQAFKLLALKYLKDQPDIVLIPGVLKFRYLENTGMAFGMLQGRIPVLIFVCLVFFVFFIYFFSKVPKNRYYMPLILISLFMFAGALGNFTDRVLRGYVIDYIYFSLIDFPVFNLADIYVVCSCIALIFFIFFKYKDDQDFAFLKVHRKD